ncbi:MAG: peptide chain release factor 2 [Clostridia bacterium]|nr:peptide chain release factor 2 [Clostridia bacterium]
MFSVENLNKELEQLEQKRISLTANLDLVKIESEIVELREKMIKSNFWDNQAEALQVSKRAESLKKDYDKWQQNKIDLSELKDLLDLAITEDDKEILAEIGTKIDILKKSMETLELLTLYNGAYDSRSALISISSGTGGIDAQDWAQILERMYLRYAEQKDWQVEILDRLLANEAGIKSVMMRMSGLRAYGNLKSENGTHRLLRNSPFNADNLRQTSFASVEVVPDIPAQEIEVKEEDVRLDVFRSSGPGGQSVNTTDSAVRLTHLASGIVVSCQSERSQHQNKENAFSILRAKLKQLELKRKEAETKNIKGEVKAEWGQQIRSYWFYGNRLVKDHRTNYSETDVDAVLAGNIQKFINAYLYWKNSLE